MGINSRKCHTNIPGQRERVATGTLEKMVGFWICKTGDVGARSIGKAGGK